MKQVKQKTLTIRQDKMKWTRGDEKLKVSGEIWTTKENRQHTADSVSLLAILLILFANLLFSVGLSS